MGSCGRLRSGRVRRGDRLWQFATMGNNAPVWQSCVPQRGVTLGHSFNRNTVQISSAISVMRVILRERAPKRSFGRRPKDLS
jgi:hypothetical protein